MGERICDAHATSNQPMTTVMPYRYTENGRHVMLCARHAHAAGDLVEFVNVAAAHEQALAENARRGLRLFEGADPLRARLEAFLLHVQPTDSISPQLIRRFLDDTAAGTEPKS